jgi:Family of unknown function (DUF6279)
MQRITVLRTILAVALVGVLMAGCTRLLAGQMDRLAVWYADGYMDLRPDQEVLIKSAVVRSRSTLRSTQLPAVQALLTEARVAAAAPLTRSQVASIYQRVDTIAASLRTQLAPDIVALARTLSDEQVADLMEQLEEENQELADEFADSTPAQRQERASRQAEKAVRRLTGRLSPEQELLIRQRLSGLPDLSLAWQERRLAQQAALRSVLAQRSTPTFDAQMAGLVVNANQFDSARYRELSATNLQRIFAMVADLANSLDDRQREHLQRRLDDWSRDAAAIMAGP